uniref:Uncharacterized protein n=1 Tax=Anguilla anguilla TaxID=7936 RepID=A0A0E9TH86_ANGAN
MREHAYANLRTRVRAHKTALNGQFKILPKMNVKFQQKPVRKYL